ncbi:MAG: FtsQ-type POTRA domain-containing protein [Clostridia bacterium]|nr:FtsQ-type POTRA domain-containing protein [Clostridia bacterium]
MKKKVIVGVCSLVLTIGLIALLAFTLFSVKEVKIDYRTSRVHSTATDEEVVEAGEFDMGSSVFFINKQKYIDKIENEFPYLNVLNIETVFPSTLVVHIAERQEVYAVEGEDGFYICDEEFKVLKFYETYENTSENAMLLSGDFEVKNEKVGDYLDIQNPKLYQALYANNYNLAYAQEIIKSIEMTMQYDDGLKEEIEVLKLSLYGGQTVTFANYKNNLTYKTFLFTQVYSALFDMVGKESLQADESYATLTVENLKTCEIYINNYYTKDGNLDLQSEKCYFKIFVAQGV